MSEIKEKHETSYDPIGADLLINILSLTVTSVCAYLTAIPLLEKRAKKTVTLPILRGIRDQADLLANAIDDFVHLLENAEIYHKDASFMKRKCTIKDTLMKLKLRDYRRWYEKNDKLSRIRVATNEIHLKIEQINLQTRQISGLIAYDENLINMIDGVIDGFTNLSVLELAGQSRLIVEEISSRTHDILAHYM